MRKTALAFEDERERALRAEQRIIEEREHAERERIAKDLLASKLRELGVGPDTVLKPAG